MGTTQAKTASSPLTTGPAVDRRRSPRRRLHRPSGVHLCGLGDELDWQCAGDLLNASLDGVACRVPDRRARGLFLGQLLQVVFRVGSSPMIFDLKARIANVTPAGSADYQVLGLEFIDDAPRRAARPALREALARANEPPQSRDQQQP